jgi:hypothetical protein
MLSTLPLPKEIERRRALCNAEEETELLRLLALPAEQLILQELGRKDAEFLIEALHLTAAGWKV